MRKLAGAVLLVVVVAGCSPATGDQAFLDAVTPHMRPIDDPAGLVDIGRDICGSNKPAAEVTQSWADAGFREGEAKALVDAAVTKLCPERKDWLNGK